MPVIRISDEVYSRVEDYAGKNDRPIGNAISFLISRGLEREVGRPPKVEINPLTIPGVMKGNEFIPKPPDPETGYPCCLKAVPCKHWVYNGTEGYWKNVLTGKTREVNG